MWRRWGWSVVLVAGAVLAAAGVRAESERTVLTVEGYVDAGDFKDNEIWFTLSGSDQRFELNAGFVSDAEALYKMLGDSFTAGRSVTVQYDPDTAFIDTATSKPTYIARAIVYDGKTYPGDEASPSRSGIDQLGPREQAEFALGRGVAYADSGDTRTARPLLDAALRYADLPLALKILAAKTHAEVIEGEGLMDWPIGDDRDRALIAALADDKAWSQLAPDSDEAATALATVHAELGDYDTARKIDADAAKRWPDRAFHPLIGVTRMDRITGNYAKALTDLDAVGTVTGALAGMPYHFHRGWVLSLMGRDQEAIADYTEGLTAQPDYGWAYLRRACSEAVLGELKEAATDYAQGRTLLRADYALFPDSPAKQTDLKRLDDAAAMLASVAATDPHRKIAGLCDGYWDWGDQQRPRSKLLPATP